MADALLASELIDDPDQFTSKPLVKLDESLRCPICSELFKGAVLLQCLHSFCSECIRDALSVKVPPRCPVCSAESDQGRIRINPALDDAVRFWREARSRILELDTAPPPTASTSRLSPPGRPSRASHSATHSVQLDSSDDEPVKRPTPLTRSRPTKQNAPAPRSSKGKGLGRQGSSDVEIMGDATPERPTKRLKTEAGDASDPKAPVACPMCQTVMAQAKVYNHVQNCDGVKKEPPPAKSNAGWAGFMSSTQSATSTAQPPSKLLARRTDDGRPVHLPLIMYTAATLKSLKAKLEEVGLPLGYPASAKTPAERAEVYKRRHREFVLKWNANCDVHPDDSRHKTEAQLKEELRQWEARQDKSEKVDIGDKDQWKRSNADQFRALTAMARASARAGKIVSHEQTTSTEAGEATELVSDAAAREVAFEDVDVVEASARSPLGPADTASAAIGSPAISTGPPPDPPAAPTLTTASAPPVPPVESPAPPSPVPARRSTRTRTVAFADVAPTEEPPRSARPSASAVEAVADDDEEESDSMDEEGQLKMPRPSQRVRAEEELWKRRQAAAEAAGDEESSGSEEEVGPLMTGKESGESEGEADGL